MDLIGIAIAFGILLVVATFIARGKTPNELRK